MLQWDLFKANARNVHEDFEHLCYLLFCNEYNRPYGVKRYKNQTAIECEPIEQDGKYIAFQAKFYDSKLSEHKNELKKILDDINKKYPHLTHLKIYTNQDLTEGKKGRSKFEEEIDKKAQEYSIEIEWRTNDRYFKSLDMIKNKHIIDFFMNTEFRQAIESLQNHASYYLARVSKYIEFNSQKIQIDRNDEKESIKDWIFDENLQNILLINGDGGVGKTSVVKEVFEQLQDEIPFFVFESTIFSRANYLDDLFPRNLSHTQFNDFHKDYPTKVFVIDSAEKILDFDNSSIFEECINHFSSKGWKILLIARHSFSRNLARFLFSQNIKVDTLEIGRLSKADLEGLATQYNFTLPSSTQIHLLDLLCIPMYLSLFLRFPSQQIDQGGFKAKILPHLVSDKYVQGLFDAVIEKSKNNSFFVNFSDNKILKDLEQKGTIRKSDNQCYVFSHDVYEDIILYEAINNQYNTKRLHDFFDSIGSNHRVKKIFKDWFLDNPEKQKNIAEKILDSSDIEMCWKNEIVIAILQSKYSQEFFDDYSKKILEDFDFFRQICSMLLVACRTHDKNHPLGEKLNNVNFLRFFNVPQGEGWKSFIDFIYNHKDRLEQKHIPYILDIFKFWNAKHTDTTTTRKASLLTFEWINKDCVPYGKHKDAHQIIIHGCRTIRQELEGIFNRLLNETLNRGEKFYFLVDSILGDFLKSSVLVTCFPEYCVKLATKKWVKKKQFEYPLSPDFACGINSEDFFGLSSSYRYFPESAYQTPLYALLLIDWKKGFRFAVDFINQSISHCHKLNDANYHFLEIELHFAPDQRKTILHSQALWQIYRGNSSPAMPHLLCSLHMALEKFLLDKRDDAEILEMLEFLLRETKTSSIVAIVSSIVLAIPEKAYPIALLLFETIDFLYSDHFRRIHEEDLKMLYTMGYRLDSYNDIFNRERLKTLKEKYRKRSLSDLCLLYQQFRTEQITEVEALKRRGGVWGILDRHFEYFSSLETKSEFEKTCYQILLTSDTRKSKPIIQRLDKGMMQITFEIKEEYKDSCVFEKQEIADKTIENWKLQAWAQARLEGKKEEYSKNAEFENNCSLVVQKIDDLLNKLSHKNNQSTLGVFEQSTLAYLAIVLCKDFAEKISKKDKQKCEHIILLFAKRACNPSYRYSFKDGVCEAVQFLYLLNFDENIQDILLTCLNRFEVINFERNHFYDFAIFAIKNLSQEHQQKILVAFIERALNQKTDSIHEAINLIHNINIFEENTILKILTTTTLDNDLISLLHTIVDRRIADIFQKDTFDYEDIFFIDNLTEIVFALDIKEACKLIKLINNHFLLSDGVITFLTQIIYLQDRRQQYDKFWRIWDMFFENVVKSVKNHTSNVTKQDEQANQLIWVYTITREKYGDFWSEKNKEWHTMQNRDRVFYERIVEEIGNHPTVLYCIAKILTTIGKCFEDRGISWIAKIIDLYSKTLGECDDSTIFILENFLYEYLQRNRAGIRKDGDKIEEISCILDFMIGQGSVIAYFMRENLL